MKTDKVIIYDDSCPLCTWYTNAFVHTGMLDKQGRQCFSSVDAETMKGVDAARSRNEIPVIDKAKGKVYYGIDGLLEVLAQKLPWIKIIGRRKIINTALKKLYKLISYNRRVIVAAEGSTTGFDCTPDFNYKYRLLFLLLGAILNTAILFPLHTEVFAKSIFNNTSIVELQVAHCSLVMSNLFIATHLNRREAFEYLGQVNMLAVVAMLLTLPLMVINQFMSVALLNNLWLALILFVVVKEYFRRMQFAGILQHHRAVMPVNIFCLMMFLLYLAK